MTPWGMSIDKHDPGVGKLIRRRVPFGRFICVRCRHEGPIASSMERRVNGERVLVCRANGCRP